MSAGHEHRHHHGTAANERRVFLAMLLTGSFMLAEAVGGILSGSLALLADAGHMLTDTGALALSWLAFRMSRRPASPVHSYGHHRFQILAAFINGSALIGIAAWIVVEAVERLFDPVRILGGPMLIIALLGLVVNAVSFAILHRGGHENLNVRGAALHVLGDLLGSAGAILAAVVILLTGWTPIDPILSVAVALLVVRSAWNLVQQSWHVLMEGTPEAIDIGVLRAELTAAVPGVKDVHHVHVWSLTPERPLATMHATLAATADHDEVLHRLQHTLAERFGLRHATIQLERKHCSDAHARTHAADAGHDRGC